MRTIHRLFVAALIVAGATAGVAGRAQEGVSFRSGVEIINVTATVTDGDGRFVPGLQREDFSVYEDGELQEIAHFSSDRVPVSLGIALDASGSMTPAKMAAARAAIDRLAFQLLGPDDELFFLRFASRPQLVQAWTSDRRAISSAVARVVPAGGTALYDAIADALPVADAGRNPKKALLVITDGNDTSSRIAPRELRERIRESDVLVYALGVDGASRQPRSSPVFRGPIPFPFPVPGRAPRPPPLTGSAGGRIPPGERVNGEALRQITDDTGGRTEIVRGFADLDGATARLADELSRQYFLGYASSGRSDGQWHAIRVEVKDRKLAVRARRGYIGS